MNPQITPNLTPASDMQKPLSPLSKLPIALDVMGGDHAPDAPLEGAIAAHKKGLELILVGDLARLHFELSKRGEEPRNWQIEPSFDVIGMDDHAADVRKRPLSSIQVATRLVKDGRASAVVSMGHSGAMMASALLTLGRLPGVDRPAYLNRIPNQKGMCLLLDVGANADVKPQYYLQWAILASRYLESVQGLERPSVGLMSIGEEESKGSALVIEAHALLRAAENLNFYGNVEGYDLFRGTTDIIVTDGFTGNVLLKSIEGEAKLLFGWIKEALSSDLQSKIGGLLVRGALKKILTRVDPSEYGSALLIGVKGLSFIGHGGADAKAVMSGLLYAQSVVEANTLERLQQALNQPIQPT